jgi:hypothetical protein
MKTRTLFLLGALVLAVSAWGLLRATEPPRTTGKVLVLDNERTLEGDIERVGDQYRVRRSVGETWVPGDKVKRLCASLEEAYAYLRTRANLEDADEHLRLAHWCQLNGLRDQALAEVQEAVALRPNHVPSQRLLANLKHAASAAPVPAGSEACEPVPVAPPLDVDAESQALFVTKVQPILMNACANCHAGGRAGIFKLWRAPAAQTSRRTTQQNLVAALAQVNAERPEMSPFLIKAVSVHGDMTQAPLRNRQMLAYRTLEDWVKTVTTNNPQLRERTKGAAAVTAAPDAPPVKLEAAPGAAARPLTVSQPAETAPSAPPAVPAQAQPPVPLDPFDPVIFNRQMHPQRHGQGKTSH